MYVLPMLSETPLFVNLILNGNLMAKPLIGISGNFNAENGQTLLSMAYVKAVFEAGGCPVVLPPCGVDQSMMADTLDRLDALLFSGGGDFTPEYLEEDALPQISSLCPERDAYEFPLIKLAFARQMPILGICRGEQLLNLAMGGTIFQDLPSQKGTLLEAHSQSAPRDEVVHAVEVNRDSLLAQILGEESFKVNSFHHQAVKRVAEGLKAVAFSADGVVEAVESDCFRPVLGVQWHPECLTNSQPVMRNLFLWLTAEASLYHKAREVQSESVSCDFHCDAPMFFDGNYDIFSGGTNARGNMDFDAQGDEKMEVVASRVDLQKMALAGQNGVVMAAYIRQLSCDQSGMDAAVAKARWLLNGIRSRVEQYPEVAALARTPQDIINLKKEGRIAVIQSIENGYALAKNINLVDEFADMGVVYITLCHNGHNDICDSAFCQSEPEYNGLSDFGRKVIRRMNERGVMVDVSHASQMTFYDVMECSQASIIASHSSVWSLCHHDRNLKDEQIRQLAENGGVMGICFYSGFLAEGREATIKDIVAHIKYVCDLVGVDYVGIGSDFDGGGGVRGCNDASELFCLTRELVREGFSTEDIRKILGGNFLRVMQQVQSMAGKK